MEEPRLVCPNCGGHEYFATGSPTCVRCDKVVGEDSQTGVLMVTERVKSPQADNRLQPPDLGYTQEQCDASGINFIRDGGTPF